MKPNRNEIIRKHGVSHYREKLLELDKKNDFNIEMEILKLDLKEEKYEDFLNRFNTMCDKYGRRPPLIKEYAKYLLFIKKDFINSEVTLNELVEINPSESAWVHFFSHNQKNYYEKLCDGLLYTAIPKNASTSLKTFIIKNVLKKDNINPHSIFGNPFFKTTQFTEKTKSQSNKVLVLRRPEDRFFSYFYKNIISEDSLAFEYGISSSDQKTLFGLNLKPSITQFIDNFERYCVVFNDVLHHTLPQSAYIGSLKEYDFICDISEVDQLVSYVAKQLCLDSRVKKTAPKEMIGNSKKIEHEQQTIDRVKHLYKSDYVMLSEIHNCRKVSENTFNYCPQNSIYSFLR